MLAPLRRGFLLCYTLAMFHWFLTVTGSNNPSGTWYGWWSGFCGDLGLFAGITILYKKVNCHIDGCRRIGLHHVEGTPYIVCRKHHPQTPDKVTVEHVHAMHKNPPK